jgi:hypothetical protein
MAGAGLVGFMGFMAGGEGAGAVIRQVRRSASLMGRAVSVHRELNVAKLFASKAENSPSYWISWH